MGEIDMSGSVQIGTPAAGALSQDRTVKFHTQDVCVFYGAKQALFDVNLDIFENEFMALIGPSGRGKSTCLTSLTRMKDTT